MQVAAASPRCVRREEIPADTIEAERNIYRAQASGSGKPPAVIEKIVDGKLEKFFADICLLEQPFIKDPQRTVGQLVTDSHRQDRREHRGAPFRPLSTRRADRDGSLRRP